MIGMRHRLSDPQEALARADRLLGREPWGQQLTKEVTWPKWSSSLGSQPCYRDRGADR
jgi:hypothetical protein